MIRAGLSRGLKPAHLSVGWPNADISSAVPLYLTLSLVLLLALLLRPLASATSLSYYYHLDYITASRREKPLQNGLY